MKIGFEVLFFPIPVFIISSNPLKGVSFPIVFIISAEI